jgi:hypothetical protein
MTNRNDAGRLTDQGLRRVFESPNVSDSNLEPANVVDVLDKLAYQARKIADAIAPVAVPGRDAHGGSIECLTEAVMSVGRSLDGVAEGLREIAAAVRETRGG